MNYFNLCLIIICYPVLFFKIKYSGVFNHYWQQQFIHWFVSVTMSMNSEGCSRCQQLLTRTTFDSDCLLYMSCSGTVYGQTLEYGTFKLFSMYIICFKHVRTKINYWCVCVCVCFFFYRRGQLQFGGLVFRKIFFVTFF